MIIKAENLCKRYGNNKVLKGVNFNVEKGEVYGFLGHNGAGKTTTMNILAGIIDYNDGNIKINSLDMKENRTNLKGTIGYLPEEPKFYPYMTANEYLAFIGEVLGFDKNKIKSRNKELLELVKLEESCNRKIGGYSRGMKQRLGIAVSMYNNPEILLLDEPSSALDPTGRKDVVDIIEDLKDLGITVFLSTHILSDIERVCDRVGILQGGKIILEEKLDILKKRYLHPIYDIEFEKNIKEDIINTIDKDWIEEIKVYKNIMNIYVNEDIDSRDIMKVIAEINLPILSLNLRRSNLEDIFIKVVSENE
ncbi:ABC transporter ATP-binding protein [Anaeromonas frigoriresistens]|uniref:ABC transporter ATP-binding protein n=1 Tax=Anaeromonas frigoriresistens TaxID=2683708 RepID=UPI001A9C7BA0|nr:ABC transporter ATP-binding protein [Anaeromonas frigoriresistens]